jgi:hypothetical protein
MRLRHSGDGTIGAVIDLKQLWPGDVLLMAADTATSAIIRKVTRSRYSHAALHIGRGLIFESTPSGGLGFAAIQPIKAEGDPLRYEFKVFGRVAGATLVHVYRHRDIAALNPEGPVKRAMQKAIFEQTQLHWGRDYAKLRQLGATTPLLSKLPRLKRWILDSAGARADQGKLAPGAFCSQLIVEVLTSAGWPPLKSGRAQEASPQDLADNGKSFLQRQPQTETQPDPNQPCDQRELETWLTFASAHGVAIALNPEQKFNIHTSIQLHELQRRHAVALKQMLAAIAKRGERPTR